MFQISPSDFGLQIPDVLKNSKCSAEESAKLILDIFKGERSEENARNLVLMNAAAAIFVAGKAENLRAAFEKSRKSLESGKALEKLRDLIALTNI
jgi:anthranilate phosphoribosyltransferase